MAKKLRKGKAKRASVVKYFKGPSSNYYMDVYDKHGKIILKDAYNCVEYNAELRIIGKVHGRHNTPIVEDTKRKLCFACNESYLSDTKL